MTHPVDTLIADGVAVSKSAFRSFTRARSALVMESATEVQNTDLSGQQMIFLKSNGRSYALDTSDTTSAHDGSAVLVDSGGLRFKVIQIAGVDGSNGIDGAGHFTRVRAVDTTDSDPQTAYQPGQAVDGVTLAENDLVLRACPTAGSPDGRIANGVYLVPASASPANAVARHTSFDAYDDLPGVYFSVMEGTSNADTLWRVTSDKGGTIDVDALAIEEFEGGASAAEDISFSPAGNLVAADVQAAIEELDSEKASLAAANAFTNSQTITTAGNPGLTVVRADDGATSGPQIIVDRNSASPADNDFMGGFFFRGRNDAAEQVLYGWIDSQALDVSDGSEDGTFRFVTIVGGVQNPRLQIAGGVFHPSATGGDKGNNTINFGAVYDDDSLLTCMALATEFRERGEIDLAKWDSLVPDIKEPEFVEEVQATRRVKRRVVRRTGAGDLIERVEDVEEPDVEWEPIHDEKGHGVGAVLTPVIERRVRKARIIKRVHRTARLFKAMCDDGFDPRDPEQYFARMQRDEALPGMPTREEWKQNGLSMGEQFSRKWLAMEMLAIVSNVMWGKLKEHETRLIALETERRAANAQHPD